MGVSCNTFDANCSLCLTSLSVPSWGVASHSLKTPGAQNVCANHLCAGNISLSSLSLSVQPRRGGHIMVHHSEGLCQCGHLRQGGLLRSTHDHYCSFLLHLMTFDLEVMDYVYLIVSVWSRPAVSAPWGWEMPAVEFGKLCSAHCDSSWWLNSLRGLYANKISHQTVIFRQIYYILHAFMCAYTLITHVDTAHKQTNTYGQVQMIHQARDD